MTAHDLRILAEHFGTPWSEACACPHGGWPDVASIDIAEYVDKAMDGAIVDDMDPFDYLANPNDAAIQRRQARTLITNALVARYRRPLNGRDLALISMAVLSSWERRAERAKEAAFDHAEGALWRNVDMNYWAGND